MKGEFYSFLVSCSNSHGGDGVLSEEINETSFFTFQTNNGQKSSSGGGVGVEMKSCKIGKK